jgi:hypothetical protein
MKIGGGVRFYLKVLKSFIYTFVTLIYKVKVKVIKSINSEEKKNTNLNLSVIP